MTPSVPSEIVVLVVDDDAVDRTFVRRAMRGTEPRISVVEAKDETEAFEVMRTRHVDCAILDYRLPRTDGLTVLRQVREEGLETPVIMLTGQGDEQLAVDIMKAGATDYLPKHGLAVDRIRQAVIRAVRARRAEIAAEEARRRSARLHGVMSTLAVTRSVAEVAHAVISQGIDAFGAGRGLVALVDEQGRFLDIVCSRGYGDEELSAWNRLALERKFPLTDAVAKGEPIYFSTFDAIQATYPELTPRLAHRAGAAALLPLCAGANVLGVVTLVYAQERAFDEDRARDLSAFARVCAQALERAQLFELANRERERAEAASLAKDEFLAVVSHELRTPLNAILGWAALLRGGTLPPERVLSAAEVIERNARSQAQLIEDLLDVSRIITGKMRIELSSVDVAQVLSAALDVVRPAADAKQIKLHAQLEQSSPAPASITGDSERLQQVFWNLLSNAVKFTPRDGRVHIRLSYDAGGCVVEVQDAGQGMAPGFLPHAFERFRQEDRGSTRKASGLGLGLSIARHIVELHGGTVEVSSPGLGLGSTFTVRLPYGSSVPPAPVTPRTIARVDGEPSDAFHGPPELSGRRVLIVDDEQDARELLASILHSCGCIVRTASSAEEALALLRAEPPEVLVSDLGMPVEDGYSLIKRVRQLPPEAGGRTAAVALTAYARSEDRAKALLAGFDSYVAKPVEPRRLVQLISSLFAKAE